MSQSRIESYLLRHEKILAKLIEEASIPAERVREAISYALFSGGKRIRPLLVYLCGELIDANLECLDTIAAAIEITHCYSLIHDDLPAMDNDDLRRGRPSCHRAFDEATAILAGDGMQALAIEILLGDLPRFLADEKVIAISKELLRASGLSGMVSGQSFDLSELSTTSVQESRLRYIHQLKTGCLISACINMVLLTEDVPATPKAALIHFAQLLGLVFQMQDDYLDHFSNLGILAKGRASDRANHKTTFASLYPQDKLATLIAAYYQRIDQTLEPFASQAEPLKELLGWLQQRV